MGITAKKVAAIIVCHNSQATIDKCLQGVMEQDYQLDSVTVVDSGSDDKNYLAGLRSRFDVRVTEIKNVGFARANNAAYEKVASEVDFVLLVNPDLFLPPDFLSSALVLMAQNDEAGIVSGRLLGYDLTHDRPSGKLDSAGIMRKWYGRWYDRGQGEQDRGQYMKPETVPALCGALMLCRNGAIRTLDKGRLFDQEFFMYKEDIELSMRMRKAGWKLLYHPLLKAYHCRGWCKDRHKIPFSLRVKAAESEVLLYRKHPSPYILWALSKYLLVVVFRI